MIWGLRMVKASLIEASTPAGEHADGSALLRDPSLCMVYEAFESNALAFRKNCSQTLEILMMPVPFAYFHATKLLLLTALSIISYSLVEIVESPGATGEDSGQSRQSASTWGGAWAPEMVLSLCVFSVISGIMIGLQAIAVRMSDPFGDDDTDFNLDSMIASAYNTAMDILLDEHELEHSKLPKAMNNPLLRRGSKARAASMMCRSPRTWAQLTSDKLGDATITESRDGSERSGSWQAEIAKLGAASAHDIRTAASWPLHGAHDCASSPPTPALSSSALLSTFPSAPSDSGEHVDAAGASTSALLEPRELPSPKAARRTMTVKQWKQLNA